MDIKFQKINSASYVISGDTYINEELTKIINKDENISALLIDCSFPEKLENIAKLSNHLTPHLVKQQISQFKNKNLEIYVYHVKHCYLDNIKSELDELKVFSNGGKILEDGA